MGKITVYVDIFMLYNNAIQIVPICPCGGLFHLTFASNEQRYQKIYFAEAKEALRGLSKRQSMHFTLNKKKSITSLLLQNKRSNVMITGLVGTGFGVVASPLKSALRLVHDGLAQPVLASLHPYRHGGSTDGI